MQAGEGLQWLRIGGLCRRAGAIGQVEVGGTWEAGTIGE